MNHLFVYRWAICYSPTHHFQYARTRVCVCVTFFPLLLCIIIAILILILLIERTNKKREGETKNRDMIIIIHTHTHPRMRIWIYEIMRSVTRQMFIIRTYRPTNKRKSRLLSFFAGAVFLSFDFIIHSSCDWNLVIELVGYYFTDS